MKQLTKEQAIAFAENKLYEDMTDKEKIRTEIERRYKYNKEHENDWAGTSHFWQRKEDEEILSFIDSMQEESTTSVWRKERYGTNSRELKNFALSNKSLRSQKQWKPTEDDLECLSDAIHSLSYPSPVLGSLLEQLKKLMEE